MPQPAGELMAERSSRRASPHKIRTSTPTNSRRRMELGSLKVSAVRPARAKGRTTPKPIARGDDAKHRCVSPGHTAGASLEPMNTAVTWRRFRCSVQSGWCRAHGLRVQAFGLPRMTQRFHEASSCTWPEPHRGGARPWWWVGALRAMCPRRRELPR